MSLTLKESRAARDLAQALYDFLPGSGNAKWKGHVSFKTVAAKVGVGDLWQPGSKLPMIAQLLEGTLLDRRQRFEPLILEIVRAGLTYRNARGTPVRSSEIEIINGLILEIGFRFPDLWDPALLVSLDADGSKRAEELVRQSRQADRLRESVQSERARELGQLKSDYLQLHRDKDRQRAGLLLEKVLNRAFDLHNLSAREAFRVTGEQIDGSFELDHEVYLLEAKWQKDPSPANDLYVFREKVEGKSKFTRGVFVSINGVSADALTAITHGKQAIFFIIDGYDLMMALEDAVDLAALLRRRQHLLAEEGRVFVPYTECGF